MLLGLALIAGTIGLGALLAFVPGLGGRGLWAVRLSSLVLAVAVVAFEMMPEAIGEIGPAALLALALGFGAPLAIERLGKARAAFEIEFFGLLAHGAADGAALWAFLAPGRAQLWAALALVAHIIPVTTALVLRDIEDKRRALGRAAAIFAATSLGLWVGDAASGGVFEQLEPWLSALASGFLLHVVAHDAGGLKRGPPSAPSG